jgi:hypothetical protein
MYLSGIQYLVLLDSLGLFINPLRDILRCRTTIRHIVFDAEVVIWTTRIMTCSQENSSIGLVLSNHIRCRGSGEDTILSNDQFCYTISSRDFENRLDSGLVEVSTIASDDESLAFGRRRIEDGLYKVLCVMLVPIDYHRSIFTDYTASRKSHLLLEHLDTGGQSVN